LNKPLDKIQDNSTLISVGKLIIFLFFAWVLFNATSEFYSIAWGTGNWRGEFSLIWAILHTLFIVFCLLLFVFTWIILWRPRTFEALSERVVLTRNFLQKFHWILWILILIIPIWFFQYTTWGLVFQKTYLRILIWILVVVLLTILSSHKSQLAGWNQFLTSIILTSSVFTIMASLREVTSYPFSLGWSEGNRLWDYSILFGRDIYIYPEDKNIFVLLDRGRQFIGGLPFLLPNVNITIARLWVGLTLILPYLLLGLATFRFFAKEKFLWLLGILWVFLFLKQGPIHPPLVIVAALVVLAWRSPYWISIPLMIVAGYFSQSRFTWVYAPPLWIAMLELATTSFSDRKTAFPILKRAFILAVAALSGAFFLLSTIAMVRNFSTVNLTPPVAVEAPSPIETSAPESNGSAPSYIETIVKYVKDQPYLWYRLLPNSTYGSGILVALLIAIIPLSFLIMYLIDKRIWILNTFQKIVILLPLLAFLLVGLVASTKIGGGGDLHNMDMFLIGLMFVGAMACYTIGSDWFKGISEAPMFIKIFLAIMVFIPGIQPLSALRTFEYAGDPQWLYTLADITDLKALDLPPTDDIANDAIDRIQHEVTLAQQDGEVLFIDQRQLLTFGYITNVPLVPEYEKKVLMNQALSNSSSYFYSFYEDLANKRFSLIISEPLRAPEKDSTYQFGEESNGWLIWVMRPILCYYEEKNYLRKVDVELLVPKDEAMDCSDQLPERK
jgi:hypothetical protein